MDILVTRRLTLRPPLEVDADRICEALQNTNVSRMLSGVPQSYSIDDAESWMLEKTGKENACFFTIHRGPLIGVASVEVKDGSPDLGYWLDESFWGQGYMSEAAKAVLSYAFGKFGYDAINSGAYEDNPGSQRVLEKLGFEPNGITPHFNPTRNCEVSCHRVRLTRRDFERRFGLLEEARAA